MNTLLWIFASRYCMWYTAQCYYQDKIIYFFYFTEVDVYYCMAALIDGSQNRFLTQTKIANEAKWRAAVILGKKHIVSNLWDTIALCKVLFILYNKVHEEKNVCVCNSWMYFQRPAFSTLSKFGVPQEQIEETYQNWMWWILSSLPLTHMVSIRATNTYTCTVITCTVHL